MLYIRSLLDELGISQDHASTVYDKNEGCLKLANSGQPSKRTRHIDTRQFAILDWVKTDLLLVKRVPTNDNISDTLTKPLGKILFHRHNEVLMGTVQPEYSKVRYICPGTDILHLLPII